MPPPSEKHFSSFNYNRIIILESLGNDGTGRRIFEDTSTQAAYRDSRIKVEFHSFARKCELHHHLSFLATDAYLSSSFPILEIEAHGNVDGIELSSQDFVSWKELAGWLRELNYALKGNLVVAMASCYGLHFSSFIDIFETAPFYAIIGPINETSSEQIQRSMIGFYTALLTDTESRAQSTLESLKIGDKKKRLTFVTSEYLLVASYKQALSQVTRKKRKKLPSIRDCLHNFFMLDTFPENVSKISKDHDAELC